MTEWGVGVLYAVLALDHMAVGPFLLSRPLVVGPVIGWALGNPFLGLLAGAVVEMMWVDVTLAGIGPLDMAMVTSLALAWSVPMRELARPALVAGLLMAVPCGMLMSIVDVWSRRQNNKLIPWVEARLAQHQTWGLAAAVLFSLASRFVKGWLMFVLLAWAGGLALRAVMASLPHPVMEALDFSGRLLPLVGFGAVLNFFYDRARSAMPDREGARGR